MLNWIHQHTYLHFESSAARKTCVLMWIKLNSSVMACDYYCSANTYNRIHY